MSAPLPDASSASAAPIAAASRHDSSWKAIAEHFARRCLCHRGTTPPRSPAVKAHGAPQFRGSRPKRQPAPRPLHWRRCSRVCHKLPPRVFPHPWPAPGKRSPHLHHPDAPPPAKYLLCSVHPALSAASPFVPACYFARRQQEATSPSLVIQKPRVPGRSIASLFFPLSFVSQIYRYRNLLKPKKRGGYPILGFVEGGSCNVEPSP